MKIYQVKQYTVIVHKKCVFSLILFFLSHVRFTPEQLGITSSTALVWLIIEILLLLLIMYILNVTTDLKYLDLLAYCGYKYVGSVSSNNFVIVIWNQAHFKANVISDVSGFFSKQPSLIYRHKQPSLIYRQMLLPCSTIIEGYFILFIFWGSEHR